MIPGVGRTVDRRGAAPGAELTRGAPAARGRAGRARRRHLFETGGAGLCRETGGLVVRCREGPRGARLAGPIAHRGRHVADVATGRTVDPRLAGGHIAAGAEAPGLAWRAR